MTSDVNGTVVAIQGNPVVPQTLGASQDGYVLTWDNADGYVVAKPVIPSGLRQAYFTSSGTWICPAGVTNVLVIAAGGGGGGSGATGVGGSGGGGGGSTQQMAYVPVSVGNYTITIGSGGSGSNGGTPNCAGPGNNGGSTTFSSLFTAQGGGGGGLNTTQCYTGGLNIPTQFPSQNNTGLSIPYGPGVGGSGVESGNISTSGFSNGQYVGGMAGTASGIFCGGGGGGAGPQGNGANGGNATSGSVGGNGASASANTGAGGGGGAMAGANGLSGGNGGNGGSGYLYILY